MLTLNDGRTELWQWDTGRTLAVDADCSQVHFSNKVFGRSIDVDVVGGAAIIPDVLLQTDKDLNVWAFVGTAENGYTKISKTFKVNRRNKPADYVFTPPDQTSLEEIKEKIDYLESIQDPDAIKNAVADYISKNPITVEETDPTVPAWAKEAQKPSYTASEVGADPSGTAAAQVTAHNTAEAAHNDIRLLISGLTDRLNALADSDDTTLDQLSEVVLYIKSNRELISAITTDKVSVADIIDNLTTNVSNKPLSAAQGVALKALIDAITVPDKLPNPNALTFTGAVTGSYDGSKPVSVEIPSGGGGGQVFANDLLAEGTIASGLAAWSTVDTGLTVGDLRSYKSFIILITGTISDSIYYDFGTNVGSVKNAVRFEWEDDAKTILMCDGYSSYTELFSNNYKADIEYWGAARPWIRFDFSNVADSRSVNLTNSFKTSSEHAYKIMGWMK